MFDFGDELTIEGYRIPWLIWIQILVLFLLILLLYCFSSPFALDLSDGSSSASASLSSQSHLDKMPALHHTSTLVSARFQVGEEEQSIKGEIGPERSKGIIRGAEDSVEMEECGTKETGHQNCYHPCHYLSLAKLAFLKCLGLDSLSEPSSKSNEQTKPR
ncbi:hypothetical protein F383_31754 [Gossypium arboreum]|uniref:Uncharacterized protein n=6 Tax=Gossypium TaxID=3633 RepID=A0A2P5Y2N6_GOSBA|nr:uncharacterized protein LOC108487484 [Gossypium arboreum]XP_040934727.1 uncharacterized protein LOC121203473 isoform X1 [Gossypium hirsutum]KAB2061549.1 hypothetical protein ES319_A10G092300v1 [Gossypium barbadense]TYG98239.1 hypothetical protein ES288_A10G101500v1 [Gossypium darwinii]TYI05611.1 hypothetical protein ES332_A10G101000v1 [Gossypium tomentosum]TYJ14123.1 hypothetical protein E1A91_A10G096200v1 [Gossypium mustelinum]KAG4179122.1 hypothetical protein ERO13_A10G086700v2 [Gossypiu